MVANISPAATCVRETVSTLGFAQRAKQIKNKVRITALCPPLTRVLAHFCKLQLLDIHGMPQKDGLEVLIKIVGCGWGLDSGCLGSCKF